MKTLATITVATLSLSALPVAAALQDAKPETSAQIVPQTVAMSQDAQKDTECGAGEDMIIVVRDESGAVVAIGKARVAPVC